MRKVAGARAQASGIGVGGVALILMTFIAMGADSATNRLLEGVTTPPLVVGTEQIIVSNGPGKNIRANPCVAFGNGVYLVAWQEGWHGDNGKARIYAARVSAGGRLLDPGGIEIAPARAGVQENPRVAFAPSTDSGQAGGNFLVVWQDSRNGKDGDILGARISTDGKVLDTEPIAVVAAPRSQVFPDVAADENGFLVAWQGYEGQDMVSKIFAARVGADGKVSPAGAVVPLGSLPHLSFNGKAFLLIYYVGGTCSTSKGVLLDSTGKPGTGKTLSGINTASRLSVCGVPGKGWTVVTQRAVPDYWGWGGPGAQRAFSLTAEGQLAADTPSEDYNDIKRVPDNWLDTSMNKKGIWPYGGSAEYSEKDCVVAVWTRLRLGGSTGIEMNNGDLIAGRLEGWKPLDKDGIPVAESPANERNPVMAGNGAGMMLCVYEKVEDGVTAIAMRVLAFKERTR